MNPFPPSSAPRPIRRLLALAAFTGAAVLAAAPEPPPTTIRADRFEMAGEAALTRSVFQGNVVAEGNNIRITCQRLEILSTRLGEKDATIGKLDRFKSLVASGAVHIVQGDREVRCGRAEIFPGEDKLVLTENPIVLDKASGTMATGEPIVLFRGERKVTGQNVQISFPPIKDLGFDKAPAPKPAPVP